MMFEYAEDIQRLADIKVAGVGGAGGNAVGRMIEAGLNGVEFLAINTDLQALDDSRAHNPLQIGAQLTKGLGSGGVPDVGQAAAEEDRQALASTLSGADMVFVTAGMGGGTGTGAAPVVADIARKEGALTVGVVTRPFAFEGRVRMQQAEEGIQRLKESVDTLIVIPNQRLLEVVPPNTSMQDAFRIADNVLYEATRGIYEIITRHDHVNLDFADVRSVMKNMGVAIMGTGRAEGENRAIEAAKAAISSPLLENVDINGSKAVLVNVLGGHVELLETAAAMQFVQDAAGPEAHVIFGYGIEESLGDTLQVTVIATGFKSDQSTGFSDQRALEPVVAQEPEPDVQVEENETEAVEVVQVMEEPVPDQDAGLEPLETAADNSSEDSATDSVPLPEEEHQWASDPASMFELEAELDPVAELELELESEPEPEPEPKMERGLVRDLSVEVPAEAEPGFLRREATAGGADIVRPVTDAVDQESPRVDVETVEAADTGRFLRPVGRRNIGEVEVPDGIGEPVPTTRSVASGLRPDDPGDDLNAPAYTRKYMD